MRSSSRAWVRLEALAMQIRLPRSPGMGAGNHVVSHGNSSPAQLKSSMGLIESSRYADSAIPGDWRRWAISTDSGTIADFTRGPSWPSSSRASQKAGAADAARSALQAAARGSIAAMEDQRKRLLRMPASAIYRGLRRRLGIDQARAESQIVPQPCGGADHRYNGW